MLSAQSTGWRHTPGFVVVHSDSSVSNRLVEVVWLGCPRGRSAVCKRCQTLIGHSVRHPPCPVATHACNRFAEGVSAIKLETLSMVRVAPSLENRLSASLQQLLTKCHMLPPPATPASSLSNLEREGPPHRCQEAGTRWPDTFFFYCSVHSFFPAEVNDKNVYMDR